MSGQDKWLGKKVLPKTVLGAVSQFKHADEKQVSIISFCLAAILMLLRSPFARCCN
jgi:hypothetical protein